ncbi:FecR family protein [Pedobacter sp. BS3]|nr:FecR family protein [Pedobacter sp. BS3]
MLNRLQAVIAAPAKTAPVFSISRFWKYAAAVILVCAIGLYFWKYPGSKQPLVVNQKNDIAPGGNKAILTLADGRKISLTDVKDGELAQQSGIRVTKTADGQLVYHVADASSAVPLAYNTLSTPQGGQYQVVLPDGTRVWLNAASSLTYPTTFSGNERLVTLTGEGYFEVAKAPLIPQRGKQHALSSRLAGRGEAWVPFIVMAEGQRVEVLGTHFNINAYPDEEVIKTTLLEGSVKVSKPNSAALLDAGVKLHPGQQAVLSQVSPTAITVNNDINIEEAVAWKNGYFMFINEPVQSIMRKISRWYNVEIVYQDNLKDKALWGTVSRFKNVSEVLKMLELTGVVHFKIETQYNGERRIIVMK